MTATPIAPYAVSEDNSRGRVYPVDLSRDRNAFSRDYDRILHSQAFRRLQGKTQVFSSIATGDDRFRTRMSHSLEVERLARSLCRSLRLNEDLAAAVALGHDIGHAPFGHLGQDVLDRLLSANGGFEHNHQALRLVDEIECPYPDHPGLNLMFETREGLLKHCTRERAARLGQVAQRHLTGQSPPLEIQVVDWADALAYCHADLDDAFTAGVLSVEDMLQVPGYQQSWEAMCAMRPSEKHPVSAQMDSASQPQAQRASAMVRAAVRHMLSAALQDLTATSRVAIERADLRDLDAVRASPALITLSPACLAVHYDLKRFSRERIYAHEMVAAPRRREAVVLEDLFLAFLEDPTRMSGRTPPAGASLPRAVADHVARMTDRYAYREHERLFPDKHRHLMTAPSFASPAAPRRKPPQ